MIERRRLAGCRQRADAGNVTAQEFHFALDRFGLF